MNKEELQEAKQLLATLKSDKWYETDADEQALAFVREHDEQWEFIDEDELDEMVKNEAQQGALRVMCFLSKCESLNPLYGWRVNGYGNIEETTLDDLKIFLEDYISNNEE